MGIKIDEVISNLSEILKEATEDESSVCYITENDAETLQVAINTMQKYQKIEKLIGSWELGLIDNIGHEISEVLEDGNDN